MENDNTTLVAFKAICNFVKDLNFAFGDRLPPLQLYAHLLDKTGLINEEPIRKHISIFQDFVDKNEEAILQKSVSLLQDNHVLKYSEKVYINLNGVIQLSETEDIGTLWTHLLTITAILKPTSRAKDILRQHRHELMTIEEETVPVSPSVSASAPASASASAGNADPFQNIGNLLETLMGGMGSFANNGAGAAGTGGIGASQNPMEMLGSLMNSPIVANMMKTFNEGDIDMPKIVDGMQKTLSTLQTVLDQTKTTSTTTTTAPQDHASCDEDGRTEQ